MTLTERSKIELIEDDEVGRELEGAFRVAYDFVKIKNLSAYVGRKKLLDVVAVATGVGPMGSVKRKSDGADLLRRDVTLVDEDALTVTVTLWGKIAEQYGQELEAAASPRVVVIRGVRVTDFNGVSVSTLSRTEMSVEPEGVPEVAALRRWYDEKGAGLETREAGEGLKTAGAGRRSGEGARAEYKRLSDFPGEDALADKPVYINNVIATITKVRGYTDAGKRPAHFRSGPPPPPCRIREIHSLSLPLPPLPRSQVFTNGNMHFKATPVPDSSGKHKRVIESGDGRWVCEANGETYESFKRQYLVNAMMADSTGEVKVNLFNAEGEALFGMSSDQLEEKRAQMDDRQFEQFVTAAACWKTFQCTCSLRRNEYKGVTSRRINLHSMRRVNFAAEARRIISEIQNMA